MRVSVLVLGVLLYWVNKMKVATVGDVGYAKWKEVVQPS